jgi:putative SOS response-associated peptidase YedK
MALHTALDGAIAKRDDPGTRARVAGGSSRVCGRFTLRTPASQLVEVFELLRRPEIVPRYNIAPTQPVAVVRSDGKSRELSLLRWGLVPSWSKDPRMGPPMINARADTIATKPAFRSAFVRRRCLIPADGFYEWKKEEKGTKQPFFIQLAKEHFFAFAGLWEQWTGAEGPQLESCTIITTEANELLRPLHDRMPVILREEDYAGWLDPKQQDKEILQGFLKPYPSEEMTTYPVSPFVNSPKNDAPQCVARDDSAGPTLF